MVSNVLYLKIETGFSAPNDKLEVLVTLKEGKFYTFSVVPSILNYN